MRKLAKFFLKILPFKKQLFSFFKVFKPSEKIFRHLYFKGVVRIPIDNEHSFNMMHYGYQLENELFWSGLQGGWEKESVGLWLKLSKISNSIMDIGANTGCYSLMSRTVNNNAYIAAFEPVERIFQKLESNIKLNNYDVVCVEKALSNFTGTATIYDQPTEHVYSVTVNKDISNTELETIPTTIQTLTLKDFIEAEHIQKIDLMKIDVETHEAEVLEGMGEYLKLFSPTMLIEILNDEVGSNVQQILDGMGYDFYNIDEQKGLEKTDQLVKSKTYNFLVCKPDISAYLGLNG